MRFVYYDPYALRRVVELSRTLALPAECDLDGATATFENGIIKGQGYRQVGVKPNRRKGRSK